MEELSENDTTLQRCTDDGGIWIDSADLNRVLLHAGLPALPKLGGKANPDEIAGQCPNDHVDLMVIEGGERGKLAYATCEACGGIWLEDAEEVDSEVKDILENLVDFYRRFQTTPHATAH
jgi:Zn-finger nucleic acid-binding protein